MTAKTTKKEGQSRSARHKNIRRQKEYFRRAGYLMSDIWRVRRIFGLAASPTTSRIHAIMLLNIGIEILNATKVTVASMLASLEDEK